MGIVTILFCVKGHMLVCTQVILLMTDDFGSLVAPAQTHPLFKDASSQIPRPEFITVSSYNKCRVELKQCIPTLVNYASHCYIGYTGVLIRGLCLLLEAVGMMLMLLSLDHHYQHTGARYDL